MISPEKRLTNRLINEKSVENCFSRLLSSKSLRLSQAAKILSVSRLELGEANLNFLVTTDQGNYVLRINMDPVSQSKTVSEYEMLRALEGRGIAPRAFVLDQSKAPFGANFLVVEYVEGRPLSEAETRHISAESAAKLARLVAGVHSLDLRLIPRVIPARGQTYDSWIMRMEGEIAYIRSNRERRSLGGRFDDLLDHAFAKVKKVAGETGFSNVVTAGHGDVCAQNVIVQARSGVLRLIDWENFGLWDPAAEIAMILEAFGLDFPSEAEGVFMESYEEIRNDNTLEERMDIFRPIVQLEQLTWGVTHVFEISNGEMNRAFIEATEKSKHVAFVDFCLARCIESGLIDSAYTTAKELEIFPSS